jgi:signal transduction histidine kinase
VRYTAGMLLIAGGYYAAAQSGEALLLTGGVGAFWPATGVGIALLYLGGLRWWPGLLLGDLLGTLVDLPGDRQPLGIALADTAGHMARAVVAAVILQQLVGRRAAMDRLEQVGAMFVAITVGEALAATVAILVRQAGGVIEVSEMGVFWRSWWLGGVAGGLVVVPLALAWAHARALVWRGRRAGEGAVMLAAVAGLSVIALSADQPLTYMVFPAFIWAALRLGPQGATLAVAVGVVIAVWAASNEVGPFVEDSASDSALNLQLYITLAALTTMCLAAIVGERRRALMDLADSRVRILAAGDAERQRIERDLHDGAQQRLAMVRMRLGIAEEMTDRDPAAARQLMSDLGDEIEDCVDEVRSLAAGIYPSLLADAGLAAALQALARQSPVAATVVVDGTDRYRPEVESAVYFCCSEALHNSAKHAEGATSVTISLSRNGALRLEVHDDGAGFLPRHVRAGHGLANMRDRMEAVGGALVIRSAPGHGTSIIGSVALP